MRRLLLILFAGLVVIPVYSQFSSRKVIPVSLSVSRVLSYQVRNIDLGTTIRPTTTVSQLSGEDNECVLIRDGEVIKDEFEINGQYLRYITQTNGLDAAVEVQFLKFLGAGVGMQYNFKADERMKLYLKTYVYLSEKKGRFDLLPAMQFGWRRLYTGVDANNYFYFGPEVDLDIRICRESNFYFSVSVGMDYYYNVENYKIEDSAEDPPEIIYVESRNENLLVYGSVGLKYRFGDYR